MYSYYVDWSSILITCGDHAKSEIEDCGFEDLEFSLITESYIEFSCSNTESEVESSLTERGFIDVYEL